MEEQLVEFETAKLAKEKGFKSGSVSHYENDGQIQFTRGSYSNGFIEDNNILFEAPTQSLLQRWLYEKYQIWVNSQPLFSENECVGVSLSITSWKFPIVTISYAGYDVYEVLEEGLQEALKLIKIKLN
jgi:hypothetical protein